MVRVTNAVAAHKRKKRLYKQAKGFIGDRKNHLKLTKNSVMKALAYNYEHRKLKKREFRSLWITRLSSAAKIEGISYSHLIHGLEKANISLNRKILSELAIHYPQVFSAVAQKAKESLAA